jgi:potassium-dependent mechanosensitive channel
MKNHFLPVRLIFVLILLLSGNLTYAADSAKAGYSSPAKLTLKIIHARLKEVEATAELDEATKNKLIELYRKSISFLETASAYNATTAEFVLARKTASKKAESIRKTIDKRSKIPATKSIKVSAKTPLAELEYAFYTEKANAAAVEAKLADFEQQLASQQRRPPLVRQRLIEARKRKAQIASKLDLPAADDLPPKIVEAKYWLLKAEASALKTEIKMLDQELLSQPMRLELLDAQLDYSTFSLKRINERVRLLQEMVNRKRHEEAERTKTEAEKAQRKVADKHPLVQLLAKKNSALSNEIKSLASNLDRISKRTEAVKIEEKRITDDFNNTQKKLKIAGMNQAFGKMLLQQSHSLPDSSAFHKEAKSRKALIAASSLRQIRYKEELRQLQDSDKYISELTNKLSPEEIQTLEKDIEELIDKRKELLDKAHDLNEAYFRSLSELDFAHLKKNEIVEAYHEFLDERLLWVPSAAPPSVDMLRRLPKQIALFFSPEQWSRLLDTLIVHAANSPSLIIITAFIAYLFWQAKFFQHSLKKTGKKILKLKTDQFIFTIKAIFLTLLLAAPWPLIMATLGWELHHIGAESNLSRAIAAALLWVWQPFFYLQTLYVLCAPDCLAAAHFRWPKTSVQLWRRDAKLMMFTFLPIAFFSVTVINLDQNTFGEGLGRLGITATQLVLAFFFYRQFSSKESALHEFMELHPQSVLTRFRILWFVLTAILALLLALLTFTGYVYTGAILTGYLLDSLWFLLALVIVQQLIVRWLLLSQRRLAFQAEMKRREAERAERIAKQSELLDEESNAIQIEEPEIDFVSMSQDSCKLLNTALLIVGVIGFGMIWSDILPAFNFLDNISLWEGTKTVAGEETNVPVTLIDLLLAFLIASITILAAKRFPALLEIFMLQWSSLSAGDRYTIKTLTNYIIIATGIIVFFNLMGGNWSQIKWLFAALGVGIGFGLQEIVANFISGLIILFERPIRVGDIVTVGDTDGVVTRIQIRATTIRNWDKKELLVPNKEFITGRLLNWSLSDKVTRIIIPVGIAYGSDVGKAKELMLEIAEKNEYIMSDPSPFVTFEAFGDSALVLKLRCYIDTLDHRLSTISKLNEEINQAFNKAGICIAFPQRDLHLNTLAPLDIRIQAGNER